ncbi:MAG: nucleotide exchange factor GrpE, partial [Burkholderiales bacterium]
MTQANPAAAGSAQPPADSVEPTVAPADGTQAAPAPEAQQTIEAMLAEAQARANEYMDRALRAQADLENLRKRSQLDVAAAHKFAIERFAESLLAVHDSLEMALRVEAPSLESLREG